MLFSIFAKSIRDLIGGFGGVFVECTGAVPLVTSWDFGVKPAIIGEILPNSNISENAPR